MEGSPKLRLGTRSSPLAMAQAHEARARLCAAHGWDEGAIVLVPVIASGDRVPDRPLAEIGGKALWTKELDAWLGEGRIDAAVHSLKDVETVRPGWLVIAAILPRGDVRDVLIGAPGLADLLPGARIGTSAPRRAAQLLHLRPDCTIVPLRGNVATRLAKLERGEADAALLAAAGLIRLGLAGRGTPLDPAEWLPAAGQGAIAIECRAGDERALGLLSAIDHPPSRAQVLAERALLLALGGTCRSPVAAICTGEEELHLRAALFSADGRERVEGEARFPAGSPDGPAGLARQLLGRSPRSVRRLFGENG